MKDESLKEAAEKFLQDYHPTRSIPVPIEEIVEFQFGIDIIPMPGFHINYEVVAFITTDLREIRIDQAVYESKSKNRYRFSLAHELSHRLLHEDVFRSLQFATVAQWKGCRDAISPKDYGSLEYQANVLAGHILVPADILKSRFQYYQGQLLEEGINLLDTATPPETWDYLERAIASDFGVSQQLIAIRGPKDGLWEA